MSKASRGFTLIELLVVIAIIGILSSVVLASLNSARQKGRDARRIADIKQLQLALELYYDGNPTQGYPAALSSLTPAYIGTVPADPADNSAYGYVQVSGTSYVLGALLETKHNVLSADYDGNQAMTLQGGATNCNVEAGNDAERVYCVTQ